MTSTLRSRRHNGSVVVEAAIVMPLFLFMCFAIVKFAMALTEHGLFTDAAKIAARLGAGESSESCQGAIGRTTKAMKAYFTEFNLIDKVEDLEVSVEPDYFPTLTGNELISKQGMLVKFKGKLGGVLRGSYQMRFPLESFCRKDSEFIEKNDYET